MRVQVGDPLRHVGRDAQALDPRHLEAQRLIVDNVDKCVESLRETGHTVSLNEVLAIEVPDHPGGLAGIMDALTEEGLNVEYMYAFVSRATEKAVVVFRFEDINAAISALQKSGVSILTADTVYSL